MPEHLIDARGHKCPVPALKLRKAMAEHPALSEFTLLADDPMAQIDVPHFCQANQHSCLTLRRDDQAFEFQIGRHADDGRLPIEN